MSNSTVTHEKSPRLIILTLDFRPDFGGVQEYLYESIKRLGSDFEVYVLTPVASNSKEEVGFKRIVLSSTNPLYIYKLLRQLKPDFVLVGHAHPKLLIPSFLNGRYGVITYGNDFLAAQNRWHHSLFNWLLKRAKPLVAISQTTEMLLQQCGLKATNIIHPGTDPNRFTPADLKNKNDDLTILTISRLVPRKGIDTVIKTIPSLFSEFPQIKYMVGGNGPEKQNLIQLAESLNVNQSVQFLGFVPDEELPHLYQDADIFIMLSHEENKESIEGFGIVYLEASATALPIIATRSGGIVEAVIDGETGILIPPNDIEACREALSLLLRSPEKRKKLGENGRKRVENEMNWDNTAKKFVSLLRSYVS